MTSSGLSPIDLPFEDQAARQRLVVTLICVTVAGCDLVGSAGVLRALACLVGAALLATTALRVVRGWSRIVTPRKQASIVLLCTSASILAAPAWVAALDPGSELGSVQWRRVMTSALVWPAIASAIAAQWLMVELGRDALERRSLAPTTATAEVIAMSPGSLVAAIGVVAMAMLIRLGEMAIETFGSGVGLGRMAAGMLLGGAVGLGLAVLVSRWIHRLLTLVREQARLDELDAVRRWHGEAASALEPLEQRLEAMAPLLDAFECELDRQASDQPLAAEAARALAPATAASIGGAEALVDRIERCHRQVRDLRGACEGSLDRENGLVHGVETAARGLVAIDHASRAVSDRMASIAEASRESTTSLSELTDAMRSVDGAADSIHELSGALVTRAEQGRARFAETVAGMEAIRVATQSADAIIRGLDARTREIGGILDVIDEVGDQTSLLALNAAIIAAQAGEHGRSFSVVAEEIRDLADRVLVSTKEIGGLIQSVQTESERAIGAIDAGSESVRNGIALAADVGRSLEEITRTSHATSTRIAAVATSVETQARILGRASELSSRIEDAVRQIETADVDRIRNHAVVSETMIGLRDAVAAGRTLIGDQTAGLSRVDAELGGVLDSVGGLTAALQNQALAEQGILRRIEAGSDRIRSVASLGAELSAAHEAIRFETGALRARSTRTTVPSIRSNEAARATGESS